MQYNTSLLAKYYHDTRKVLKNVKVLLIRDSKHVIRHSEGASDDSDSMGSRPSSIGSYRQLIKNPFNKQSIVEEMEYVEENDNGHLQGLSQSSADNTDEETMVKYKACLLYEKSWCSCLQ